MSAVSGEAIVPAARPEPSRAPGAVIPPPCLLVIFGASGDLTRRKLVPALFTLYREGILPGPFAVLGTSRTAMTDEAFRESLEKAIRESAPREYDAAAWATFAKGLFYQPSDIGDPGGVAPLAERIRSLCASRGIPGNIVYYAAVAPRHFAPLVERLGASGLAAPSGEGRGFRRIVIEKPFGRDEESARDLSRVVSAVFREDQVYRIDHYLGKETVQNLLVFRFANGIFEPIWNRSHIDHVQITVAETLGVEGRGEYYEEAGALRDMIQNHLLQLLALVAMDPPISLEPEDVRSEKSRLLRSIVRVSPERAGEVCVRGQYASGEVLGLAVPAYRQEKNVAPGSVTETYAAVRFAIDNWRWGGVPFYLRTGKRMPRHLSEIAIRFKPVPTLLFERTACGQLESNLLVLNIQPDEGIFLKFGAKAPGPAICVEPVEFQFTYERAFGARSQPAYGRLLLDAMLGDATLFPRQDAVAQSWELLAPFLSRWAENPGSDLFFYPAGSWGPREADLLLAREGRRWLNP